jgi:hypothetical protein
VGYLGTVGVKGCWTSYTENGDIPDSKVEVVEINFVFIKDTGFRHLEVCRNSAYVRGDFLQLLFSAALYRVFKALCGFIWLQISELIGLGSECHIVRGNLGY